MGAVAGRRKVLAVASGGGHWVQLQRMMPAFEGHEVVFVTVSELYARDVAPHRLRVVRDATRWDRWGSLRLAAQIAFVLLQERPDVVFTTGAAPGCFAVILGRLLGAKTIWLDSIANIDEMSMSGRMVRRFAMLWLTQWPHLARSGGPEYAGAVL